ncbi:MAG: universal stress protein, partial [Sciscionella sp.]|nr:universal stress protein [Sciscionella sp.]
ARRRRLPLRLVHAVNVSAVAYSGGIDPAGHFLEELESLGDQQLADASAMIGKAHPELDIELSLRDAHPATMLIDESQDAVLTVVGSRGLGGFRGALLGSTAVALTGHAHSPVAVIRGRQPDDEPPITGAVVVGIDGSPASEAATAWAFEEAAARDTELIAVHAWTEFASDLAYFRAHQAIVDWTGFEANQSKMLAERLAGWSEHYPDVRVHRVINRDRPVRALLQFTDDAQLVVVGSRGRGGFTGMLLGSTSRALAYHCPCPLLIARPQRDG